MKYLIFILFLICSMQIVYGQKDPPAITSEVNCQTEGGDEFDSVEFKLIPIGLQFCREASSCDVDIYSSMTSYTVELPGNALCKESGFNFRSCGASNTIFTPNCVLTSGVTAEYGPLRHSYYKVEVYLDTNLKIYFYYDNRDYGFPVGSCSNNICDGNDFTFRYDVENNLLKFFEDLSGDLEDEPSLILDDGDVITWSDWKNCDFPDFLPFWQVDIVEENDSPKLMWGPYNDGVSTTEFYKIYRAVTGSSTPPALGSFTLVKTISNPATYSWIDYAWVVGSTNYAHYYIKAGLLPSEVLSDPTEVATIGVSAYKQSSDNPNVFTVYKLNQNHPNPFNPTSIISYTIKDVGYVTLIVYDVLGKEVAKLVDGIKAAGNYQVEFNADQLPSGIYFYELKAGTFRETKKMILTR